MSKRKTGALRAQQYEGKQQKSKNEMKTYYTNDSKVIDFGSKNRQRIRSVELIPKSINQEKFILALLDESTDIVVVSGPAGTGKTYLAMLAAIRALRSNAADRLILTRPAVAVDDEKNGFFPGDLNAKMEPWTRPLLDVLREFYSNQELIKMLEDGIIEIAPLAFMRGRNFKNSWIIGDEFQNSSAEQMLMLLTRIGEGSKIIITGDVRQSDHKRASNGLVDLYDRLKRAGVKGIMACSFDEHDVQRHRIIKDILKLYDVGE